MMAISVPEVSVITKDTIVFKRWAIYQGKEVPLMRQSAIYISQENPGKLAHGKLGISKSAIRDDMSRIYSIQTFR